MKHEPLLIEVVKHQKHEKHKKAVNVLSTLQFFLDQAEMLMDRGADTPAEHAPRPNACPPPPAPPRHR
jgi:hypothetical protein